MNIEKLPISEAIDSLTPELKAQFDDLRQRPHLQDASDAEIFLMLWVLGYINFVFDGAIEFDHAELANILNFGK